MIHYQVETVAECIDEIKPLLEAHYREISNHDGPLDPDYPRYLQMCDLGLIRVMTARDDMKLVGYFVSLLSPHLHYQQSVYALNDIVYIDPIYRGTTMGYRLFKLAIADLKDNCNVDVVVIHMKVKFEFRRLLIKLGFTLAEENWEMKL